jgi:hypothetical protein
MKKRILKTLVLSLSILALQISPVLAGFGVSPTNINNEFLKPGAHFEKTITLSRSDPVEELLVTIETSLDEISSWFQFDQGLQFIFPSGETRKSFDVIVDVPEDAPYKNFEGVIRVKATSSTGEIQGVSIVKGARLEVALAVTEENVLDVLIRSMEMLDSEEGKPLKLEVVAENQGNVDATINAKITIKDLLMKELEVLEDVGFATIQPNETKTLQAEFLSTLPEGEYFVEAEVTLDGKVLVEENSVLREERLVFRIVKKGEVLEGKVVSFSGVFTFVSEYWVYMVAGVLLVVVMYLLLTKLWNTEKLEVKKGTKGAKFMGASIVSRILISLLVSAVLVVGTWYLVNTFLIVEETNVLDEIDVVVNDGLKVVEE